MLQIPDKPWWETDTYDRDMVLTPELEALAGPNGAALVRAYDDGATQKGWGLTDKDGADSFMPKYLRGDFLPRRTLYGYDEGKHAAAMVMRSLRAVAVDIDGKNGGLDHVTELGNLPFTGAEISKSATGYHLFYDTSEIWDDDEGFGLIPDQIGIVQGVDIRAVGCIYHYPTQRWNSRPIAPAPEWLLTRLLEKKQQRAASSNQIKNVLATYDLTEILMMQNNLLDELKKPIPAGRRNTTLFAIGSQLKLAEVPNWQDAIRERGEELKLADTEINRLVTNIENYGG